MVDFVEGCRQNPQGAVLSRSVGSLLRQAGSEPRPRWKTAFTKAAGGPVRVLHRFGQKPGWVLLLEAWV